MRKCFPVLMSVLILGAQGVLSAPQSFAAPAAQTQQVPISAVKGILERVKVARMWIQQKDNGEAIRQIRDALRIMIQMRQNLAAQLDTDLYNLRTGKEWGVALILPQLAKIDQGLDELHFYAYEQPTAQERIKTIKGYLAQARVQLQAAKFEPVKALLKQAEMELANFEFDPLPVTYTESQLHQAYGFLQVGQLDWTDKALHNVENHLQARAAAKSEAVQP